MWQPAAVLVAEDDPGDAYLLQRAFAKAGLDVPVRFVRGGQQVIDYLCGEPPYDDRHAYPFPTLLLLDLLMPGVNGFEVLDWLRRQQEHLPRMAVVVLSGVESQAEIDRAHVLGANVYVLKPQDPGQLVAIVRRLKEKYGLSAEAPVLAGDHA